MNIKKSYADIIKFLEENQNKKVSSILDEVYLMAESKKKDSTVIYSEDEKVFAVFCYYHKQWELISEVEYGSKANTKSGLNTMCKIGVSAWTKKQRDAKRANDSLLVDVSKGIIMPKDILDHQALIEQERLAIDETDKPKGYATEEEVIALMQ